MKKNQLNRLEFLNNRPVRFGSVRFRFYKPETGKIELNPN